MSAAEALVGMTYGTPGATDADIAAIAPVNRVIVGMQPMTMDFRPERLNVFVNKDTKVIEKVTHS